MYQGGLVGAGFGRAINLLGKHRDIMAQFLGQHQSVGLLHGIEQLLALHTAIQRVNQEYVAVRRFYSRGEIEFLSKHRSFLVGRRVLDLAGDSSSLEVALEDHVVAGEHIECPSADTSIQSGTDLQTKEIGPDLVSTPDNKEALRPNTSVDWIQ